MDLYKLGRLYTGIELFLCCNGVSIYIEARKQGKVLYDPAQVYMDSYDMPISMFCQVEAIDLCRFELLPYEGILAGYDELVDNLRLTKNVLTGDN